MDKTNSSWLKTFSIGFSIISFGITIAIVGYFVLTTKQNQTANQQPTTTSPTIPQPSPTPIDETANWKTYKNDNLGFSMQYPADYRIEEKIFSDKNGRVTFSSPDLMWEELGGGSFPKKGGEIRIEINEEKLSIIGNVYALSYLPSVISSYETKLDNVQAIYTIEKHLLGARLHQVSAKKDSRQFILMAFFAGRDEQNIVGVFQRILSTFKFLD